MKERDRKTANFIAWAGGSVGYLRACRSCGRTIYMHPDRHGKWHAYAAWSAGDAQAGEWVWHECTLGVEQGPTVTREFIEDLERRLSALNARTEGEAVVWSQLTTAEPQPLEDLGSLLRALTPAQMALLRRDVSRFAAEWISDPQRALRVASAGTRPAGKPPGVSRKRRRAMAVARPSPRVRKQQRPTKRMQKQTSGTGTRRPVRR